MNTQPNEPAFPIVFSDGDSAKGLSKREHFAAMAMQGILSNNGLIDTVNWEWVAINSVAAADALIKALNEQL